MEVFAHGDHDRNSEPGERIEELQSIAGDHLFMHAQQIEDWRGNLKIYVKGRGAWVEDIEGNRLFDTMGGLWYKAAGYGRTEIADAMYEQLTGIETPPAGSATPSQIKLAGRIASLYQDKDARTFFLSGGSEAVETAVKMAKKYQSNTGKVGAFKVISRRYSYHGATAMAVSLGRSPRRILADRRCRARFTSPTGIHIVCLSKVIR